MIDRREFVADGMVHAVGVTVGLVGAALLVPRIVAASSVGGAVAVGLYALGLLAMLGFSAAYNLWRPSRLRDWLRRFDHAAIFVMIAGTYSPLTFGHVAGAWAMRLGLAVWAVALLGVAMKLAYPHRFERLAIALYLALGWLGLLAIGPLMRTLPMATLILLLVGGVIYSAGVVFHLWRGLRFQNAIWHGFVLAAAGCHYAAILLVV
jgi:hemolysin III